MKTKRHLTEAEKETIAEMAAQTIIRVCREHGRDPKLVTNVDKFLFFAIYEAAIADTIDFAQHIQNKQVEEKN